MRGLFHRSLLRFRGPVSPSLHWIPAGWFSSFSGTTAHSDSLPSVSRHFVSFVRRYHACARRSWREGQRARSTSQGGITRSRDPGIGAWRRQGLPGSWRVLSMHALFSDPGGSARQAFQRVGCCLPPFVQRRLPRAVPLGAQWHGLHRRCLRFAGRLTPTPRKTRFRLGANLGRAGFDPQDSSRRFQLMLRSPPGFAWRKQNGRRSQSQEPCGFQGFLMALDGMAARGGRRWYLLRLTAGRSMLPADQGERAALSLWCAVRWPTHPSAAC